jgi:hypothetical protein
MAARRARPALNPHAKVLNQERHTGERAIRQFADRDAAGLVVSFVHHGVERAIVALNAFDRSLEKLRRRHLAFAHQCGKAKAIVLSVILHGVPPTDQAIG